MPEPDLLPCPFCGHVGLQFDSENGSTFRWMAYSCAGCGIGAEERIQTLDMAREPAVEAAKKRAVAEWNKRVPTASGLSADARSNETTGGGVGAEPPALTDEQIMDIGRDFALSSRWPSDWIDFVRAIERAALSAAPIGVPIYSPVSHFAVNAELLIAVKSPRFTGEPPYVGDEGLLLALREDYDDLNRLRAAPIGVPAPASSGDAEAALARHIAAAKALLPPGTCVGAVGTRCLMKD